MYIKDAERIGKFLLEKFAPVCEPDRCVIAGGTRREKPSVHDLKIVCQPDMSKKPRAVFGVPASGMPKSLLDMVLIELEDDEYLFFKQGQDRNRKYWINLSKFGLPESGAFLLDLYMVRPPAQFGVQLVIRTGPNSAVLRDEQFSKWIVTQRSKGGALPDGYCVRLGAVWRVEQIRADTDKPRTGEEPLVMPTEESFLQFLEIEAAPADRRAEWGKWLKSGVGIKVQMDRGAEGEMA